MKSETKSVEVDHIIDLLSRPLSRYILSVLAGVDPGRFRGPIEVKGETVTDDADKKHSSRE